MIIYVVLMEYITLEYGDDSDRQIVGVFESYDDAVKCVYTHEGGVETTDVKNRWFGDETILTIQKWGVQ